MTRLSLRLSIAILTLGYLCSSATAAERLFGLTPANTIVVFDSAAPTTPLGTGLVTGLAANESLIGIDYHPLSNKVVLIGSQSNVYTLDSNSGLTFNATQLGSTLSPALDGTNFAFDFNPALANATTGDIGEFARIISNLNDNNVISGLTGAYLGTAKTDVFYLGGDANATADPNIAGIAYDNNVFNAMGGTQQYGIDATLGVVATVANNAGTLETVGSLGITGTISDELGFDISGASSTAFAAIQTGLTPELYTVDLKTGAATSVGVIAGATAIRSLTTVPVPEPSSLVLALAVLLPFIGITRRRRR